MRWCVRVVWNRDSLDFMIMQLQLLMQVAVNGIYKNLKSNRKFFQFGWFVVFGEIDSEIIFFWDNFCFRFIFPLWNVVTTCLFFLNRPSFFNLNKFTIFGIFVYVSIFSHCLFKIVMFNSTFLTGSLFCFKFFFFFCIYSHSLWSQNTISFEMLCRTFDSK